MKHCNRCDKLYYINNENKNENYCSEDCEYIIDLENDLYGTEMKNNEYKNLIDILEEDLEKSRNEIIFLKKEIKEIANDFKKTIDIYNDEINEIINDDTYRRNTEKHKVPSGEIICPHCLVGVSGIFYDGPFCGWCGKHFWDKVED